MDKENIKKIISETLSSEEFMNGIIEQIQSQLKREKENRKLPESVRIAMNQNLSIEQKGVVE